MLSLTALSGDHLIMDPLVMCLLGLLVVWILLNKLVFPRLRSAQARKLALRLREQGKRLVHVEFCTSCGYGARVAELQRYLEAELDVGVVGNMEPPRSGAFEVVTDDKRVLWSKLDTGAFPDKQQLLQQLKEEGYPTRA